MIKESVDTTRSLAAIRQIRGAITSLHNGDYECAVTLAHAAEGMIPDKKKDGDGKPLIKLMRERLPDDDPNLFSSWLKHPKGAEKATISVFEVVLMIARAIHKFVWYYEASNDHFESFQDWAMLHGHLPKRITERAEPEKAVIVTGSA
jgi:hypothetical protein